MEKMSDQEERRIMNALERAVGMTNGGMNPNDALSKVAEDERFAPPVVQRMVEAYNVSKTLAHMKNANGPARADSFPLADAERVLRHIYPENVEAPAAKAASVYKPSDYSQPERVNFNKVASERLPMPEQKKPEPYPRDQLIHDSKMLGKEAGLAKKAEEAKREQRILFYKILDTAKEASDYFKLASHIPFAQVESKIWREYGQIGKSAMDMVHNFSNRHEKRAEAAPTHDVMMDINKEPYCKIVAMIKLAHDFHDAIQTALDAEAKLAEFRKKEGRDPPQEVKQGCLFDDILGNNRPFDGSVQTAATADATKEAADIGLKNLTVGEVFHGKAEGEPDSKYSPKQIQEGVKVEKEHTPNPAVAKTIAKDHLEEIPNYYVPHLKEMEEEAKKETEEKKAFLGALGSTLGDVGSAGMGAMGLSAKDPEAARRSAISEVMDPVHEAKIQAAKTKAILNDFVSNDPVLSGYEPREVMTAYNHIAELAPSVSQQPSVMRGLLRRMLQQEGVMEPHEVAQISQIERQLRGTPSPEDKLT
jgi:predicted DNA-binding WGR domain protein